MRTLSFALSLLLAISVLVPRAEGEDAQRPNILFIAIDDLNHWVGHLNAHPQTKTPHLDRLASTGVSFRSAYCVAPACNPSRAALMSGLRPSTTGVYDNGQDWRPVILSNKLLNAVLLKAGYHTFGAGKIYHGGYGNGDVWTDYFKDKTGTKLVRHESADNNGVGGIQFYPLANQDEEMPDHHVVSYGIEKLNEKHEKPFFLAIGLVKPHMPFSVPKKWFDQFPLDEIQLPPHTMNDLDDVPAAGKQMAKPAGDHRAILQSGRWKEAVQAYLATIAFCDSQVGRLLDALDASAYRNNTIVCLWSDHGWSLGEKEHWRKFALWEEPTRTTFIWRVPGLTPVNQICTRPVDYMNIYPTLCSLARVERPKHVEGLDMTPLLRDPKIAWDVPALTTFHLNNHALRSERYRYIRYADGSEELYDHERDPNEWTNVASDPKLIEVKQQFARHLPEINVAELPSANAGEGQQKAKAMGGAKKAGGAKNGRSAKKAGDTKKEGNQQSKAIESASKL